MAFIDCVSCRLIANFYFAPQYIWRGRSSREPAQLCEDEAGREEKEDRRGEDEDGDGDGETEREGRSRGVSESSCERN